MSSMEERLVDLERRLALLEALDRSPSTLHGGLPARGAAEEQVVSVSLSNKRYDHGDYEDHIWFDCVYTLSQDSNSTRALKGAIEFMDLFGEVRFRLQLTVNDPLSPGRPLANPGIGFTFNQFMPEHQWMLSTDLSDMQIRLVVSNVIYSDGSSAAFS